ncbi:MULTISPECIES: ABC transporter ATP-binding protein [Rhizobium/Agrobacterium group]|jgi:iron complex transport system ATP-binding protein|uniref:iron ABC transporter ATP-binding protein n=1 Tax=Rhizobium/Agrobacterium group TaxID=227290 RepID=UPI0003691797|nr:MULTISPECIES: ABC transporter ATP-binding protein [Rhizobium/Agrobacterium group]AHK02302.1 iron (III) dicitrate transport ATP-binding protein FecE [Agrobacterium tumefaciens LBA4213 (Ach5)]AKC08119.1 iron complex transport system ATP-binding protein [Agrobacterium tumefaciens]AYM16959.1 iron complex transport system ATP-binding protein [Agrobacterium tumefaciens]AYM68260.1 iron complex transport system ATP-binding protein [Agrobacterium tumefaciens]KAA3504870.1 ATP-binding cassette domain-
MIIASQISKSYGDTVVVDGVSVAIPAGGVTSIIGPNGAGKSTLLSIVARLMSMDAGTVTVDGLDVTKTPSDTLAKRLSILRQDNHISSRLTVRDLVGFGRYPYSKGRPTIEDKVHIDRALEYLHLETLSGRFLDELSGGQRQRAFVAMVLCQDTDYVLLDEPLNNLDMKHASSMMKIMRRAADELKKTVVLVLHDINFASWYSDTIIAMRDGRICRQGPAEQIIRPEVLREIYDMTISVNDIDGRRICLFYE